MTNFPYQKIFTEHLIQQQKASTTIIQYQRTLTDFFNYEQHFNLTYSAKQDVNLLTTADIQNYLQMLQNKRQFAVTTQNKSLSNINRYFEFLFTHHQITNLPTIELQGKSINPKNKRLNNDWPSEIDALLANNDLSYYSRLMLLAISHGFSIQNILAAGFYKIFLTETFKPSESDFLQFFSTWITPYQQAFATKDLFLKTRQRGSGFHLTLPGLHKYLKKDAPIAGMSLSPQKLRQSFILWFLREHADNNINQLTAKLHLAPAGVLYYQSLALKTTD